MKKSMIVLMACSFLMAGATIVADDLSYEEAVQSALQELGYQTGPIDGVVGPATKAAIKRFQMDAGLPATGVPGERTTNEILNRLEGLRSSRGLTGLNGPGITVPTPGGTQGSRYLTGSDAPVLIGEDGEYLGKFSASRYAPDSVANPYGRYGSRYSAESINNPYGEYGSKYSVNGARNRYTTGGARLYSPDGDYLGRVNSNRYDPESISNPYGHYGSRYSPDSVNNPYGPYENPYATDSSEPYSLDSNDSYSFDTGLDFDDE